MHILDERSFKRVESVKTRDYFKNCSVLSGKIICGECGSVYTRQVRKLSGGDRIYDWMCARYREFWRKTPNQYKPWVSNRTSVRFSEEGCDNITIKQETVYKVLNDIKCEYFGSDNQLIGDTIGLLKESIERCKKDDTMQKEIENIEYEIERLNETIRNLTENMLDGVISKETYKDMVKRYEEERMEWDSQLSGMKGKGDKVKTLEDRIRDIEAALNEETLEEATISSILEYIDKIYVYTDRFEITFHMDKVLSVENHELLKELESSSRLVYMIAKEDMKYKRNALDKTNEIIYNAIKENSKIQIQELAELTGLSRTTIHFRIQRFKELGYLGHRTEPGRKKEWEIYRELDSGIERVDAG